MRALFAALCLAFLAPAAFAQDAAAEQRREKELRDIEKRLKDKEADEKRLKNEAAERAEEVAALRRRLIETANSVQAAERRMRDIDEELKKLAAEETELTASLKAEQANLSDVLAALQSLEMSRPPALLVSPGDANRAARAAMLLADAAPALEARASALRAKLDRLAEIKTTRDRERLAQEKTGQEIAARREVLAELLLKKQAERDVAQSLARAAQREAAALAARATSLEDAVRRLERLARSITPRLKPAPPSPDAPFAIPSPRPISPVDPFRPARAFAAAKGALRPPVVGRIVNGFGDERPGGGAFDGVRFATAPNAIVTAPYEAKIAFARQLGPMGNLIMLDVGGGYLIVLGGVGAFLAQEGQTVAAGEPVAAMAAGPETILDLEIRKNGAPVNPALWLSRTTMEDASF